MDKNEILKEAKATIDNIKSAQTTLNNYLRRLEGIVEKLEFEDLKRDHLTLADVENIQEKISVFERNDDEKIKFESKKDQVKVKEPLKFALEKESKFKVYLLIFIGLLLFTFSSFLTVKRLNPNYNFFNHYLYNYQEVNMGEEVPYNSLVIVKKLGRDDLSVGEKIAYKQAVDEIKVVRVVELIDGKQNSYQAKSSAHIFQEPESLERSEILGKVSYILPVWGKIFSTLVSKVWLLYIISGLTLFIAYLVNNN